MLAIQIKSPGNVEVIDLDMPQLRPGEVLIKIDHVGFCGSDLNTFRGKISWQYHPSFRDMR